MLRYNLKDQTCQVGVVKHACYRTNMSAEARTIGRPALSKSEYRLKGISNSKSAFNVAYLSIWHCHLDLGHTSVARKKQTA